MEEKLHWAYLSFGSNLGNRIDQIESAYKSVEHEIGRIIKTSSFYSSPSWGYKSENTFINSVVQIETPLTPHEVLQKLKTIEKELGRIQKSRNNSYSDRAIDIDIIDFNGKVMDEEDLVLPHSEFTQRNFVLMPLYEIAKGYIHPKLGTSISSLLIQSSDKSNVERL